MIKIGQTFENSDGRYECDVCGYVWSALCGDDVDEVCPHCIEAQTFIIDIASKNYNIGFKEGCEMINCLTNRS